MIKACAEKAGAKLGRCARVDWGVNDRVLRRIYTRELPSRALPARHSPSPLARRRAAALQRFLGALHDAAALRLENSPDLVVLDERDWRQLLREPYGLPLARRSAPRIFAPAHYPERLLRRFDAVLLSAHRAGVAPPGELREFLDLLTALVWARASLDAAGLRSPLPWLEAVDAAALTLAALDTAGFLEPRERLLAWGRLVTAGGDAVPLSRYGGKRQPLPASLYLVGRALELAEHLSERDAWAHLDAYRATPRYSPHDRTESTGPEPISAAEPVALRTMEPTVAAWLASFAPDGDR